MVEMHEKYKVLRESVRNSWNAWPILYLNRATDFSSQYKQRFRKQEDAHFDVVPLREQLEWENTKERNVHER